MGPVTCMHASLVMPFGRLLLVGVEVEVVEAGQFFLTSKSVTLTTCEAIAKFKAMQHQRLITDVWQLVLSCKVPFRLRFVLTNSFKSSFFSLDLSTT